MVSLSAKPRIPWLQLVVGLIGFAAGLYALVLHFQLKSGRGNLSCDINNVVSCSQVIGSQYGSLFGIPLGAFGMSFFALCLFLILGPRHFQFPASWIAQKKVLLGAVGSAVVLVLGYLSYIELASVCVACSVTHASTLIFALLALVEWRKERTQPARTESADWQKLIALGFTFSIPPLLLGILGAPIFEWLFQKTSSQEIASASPKGQVFPQELISFSKSNFVGKGEDYRKGSDTAKVIVQTFSDFECPHCKTAYLTLEAVQSEIGKDNMLFVFRNFPLSNKCNPEIKFPGHPYACQLAIGARCAGQQGKFWEFKSWAYENLETPPSQKAQLVSNEGLKQQSIRLGLDASKFVECLQSDVELKKIHDDVRIGTALGLEGTPFILINGEKYDGELSTKALVRHIRLILNQNP